MSDILLSAFLLSVVLLGIHSYFGMEIIKRGIIFTDLAVGQAAALGAAAALHFFHGAWQYPLSLAAALTAGLVIAVVVRRVGHPEAFIGLTYALCIAGVSLLLSRTPHGTEELERLMAADILFTPLSEIARAAALYAAMGLLLAIASRRTSPSIWDILFFLAFAVTVTSSVRLAGVLVVFALLVGPASIALRFGASKPLATAWVIGTAVNLVAVLASFAADLPTGHTIVFMQALAALCSLIVAPRRRT